jgi:predicted DNA-binding transcriptional regulator AlpA
MKTKSTLITAEYLTEEQVSQLTGFSLKALEAMRHKRSGPSFLRVGLRLVRYRVSDVRAWIEREGAAK